MLCALQEGLAHLCLVGSSTTLVRAKVEANLPRKRGPAVAGYDKAWDKFMDQVNTDTHRRLDVLLGLNTQQAGAVVFSRSGAPISPGTFSKARDSHDKSRRLVRCVPPCVIDCDL